jgi:hypothetical protein
MPMWRFFIGPAAVSLAALTLVLFMSGLSALITVAILSVLEVTLSFDNAVLNAQVLKRMNALWRRRFLTWGILIAVVGTRLVLPVVMVSLTSWQSPFLIAHLAFVDAHAYALLLERARFTIEAFGGAFLLMLALRFFFDSGKTVHWIRVLERRMAKLGDFEAIEMAVVLWLVLVVSFLVPPAEQTAVLVAGLIAVLISVSIESFMRFLARHQNAAVSGIGLFIYLELLDTAFSLDGVVGAFALTFAIPLIVLGLGIGAYFVRSLTVYLTEHRVLESLRFIENGAYWAIFGLSVSMFASLLVEVPETVTGGLGLVFMLASYYSSVKARGAK